MLELGTLNKIQSRKWDAFFRISIGGICKSMGEWFFKDKQKDILIEDLREFLTHSVMRAGYKYKTIGSFCGAKGLTLIDSDGKEYTFCFSITETTNFIKVECSKKFENILNDFRESIKHKYNFKKVA